MLRRFVETDLSELDELNAQEAMIEPHGMNPLKALGMAKAMGGEFKRILLVGCEPEPMGADEERMDLSEPVQAAIEEAIGLIEELVTKILAEEQRKMVV
ncbi:MAG: hypothetical protein ABR577_04305 [Pyrinomonadaceae bacterium]